MVKAHTPINWENEPSYNTPLNAANLNKMDSEIGILDDRIIEQDTIKLDKSTANTMVKAISFDENTGVFTITLLNGSTTTIDTKLEKVVVNFSYDATTQQIILNLVDGTTQYIDLSALITQYEFLDSDTIAWEVTTDGKVKAKILDGSITENMLQPNYLAEIKVESGKAETSAKQAQSYAIGGTGTRENEDVDNAQYYYQQAKAISESFSGALRPKGTVTFANLPSLSNVTEGDMYNVSDQFTTTSSFKEGSGLTIPAGSNVYKTSDGKWDVLAGSPVTGVKGNAESSYRNGNVNITPANIGLGNVPNVTTNDQTPTFTQTSARANISSGEKLSVIFGKIMKFFADLKTVAFSGSYNDLSNKPSTATTSANGFMSSTDKAKLDGIAAGAQVNSITGVKGNAESSYRTGNVNLTPANLGALATNGDSKSNNVTFTSNDVADESATSWTSVTRLASGITHDTFFQRVSQMFKNVRYLYKVLGTTNISSIGNGTVTDAISTLNSNLIIHKAATAFTFTVLSKTVGGGEVTIVIPKGYRPISFFVIPTNYATAIMSISAPNLEYGILEQETSIKPNLRIYNDYTQSLNFTGYVVCMCSKF